MMTNQTIKFWASYLSNLAPHTKQQTTAAWYGAQAKQEISFIFAQNFQAKNIKTAMSDSTT